MTPRWQFGVKQTHKDEQAEMNQALQTGQGEAYIRGQRYLRLIEAETARRRARHPGRDQQKAA